MFELVVVDPAELVDASVLEVLLPLPLLPHAVSTAAAASRAAHLVIVSDLFLLCLMGSSWNASLR